jgi:hypothetical protein
MTFRKIANQLGSSAAFLIFALCPAFAQGPAPDAPTVSAEPVSLVISSQPTFDGADFAVTRANLQGGGQELNPVVRVFGRSTPALAVNFVGETAGVIAVSYFFHKTGHHTLERVVSLVNIGSSAGAVSYGLAHR